MLAKGAYLGEFWVGTILDPLDKFKVNTLRLRQRGLPGSKMIAGFIERLY